MFLQVVISILTGLSVVLLGSALLVYHRARLTPLRVRLHQIETSVESGVGGDLQPHSMNGFLQRIGQFFVSAKSSKLKEELAAAGFHTAAAPTIYLGVKMVLLCVGIIAGLLIAMPLQVPAVTQFSLVVCIAVMLFFLPNFYVYSCRQRRRLDVQCHLPDAIDLLEICVSAGMGLDQAWNAVSREVRQVSPTLADEMTLNNLEIQLGASRAVAMRHMAERTESRDLASLVAILVQTERFGTSVADALQTFATSMRETRSQRAQEHAEKMAVKLIFPMVIFIFPAVVIVMAGPGFMSLMHALAANH